MAWSAGVTRSTGDLITAAQWNSYLGAAGSLEYLKTQTDKLDDCSSNPVSGSRAIDSIYQNNTKIRIAMVSFSTAVTTKVRALIHSGTPPTTEVGYVQTSAGNAGLTWAFTFVIPPSWYYEVEESFGTATLRFWHEWDLL